MINNLEKVCSEYCMDASDTYNILLSRNADSFPLSFDTVRNMVLKEVPSSILKDIFTQEELKNIFRDTNLKKIKKEEIKKFINSLK